MSTLDPTLDTAGGHAASDAAAGHTTDDAAAVPSIFGVLTTSDHKVIGRLLIGSAGLGLLIVGALGAVLGFERIDGDDTVIQESVLTQLFAGYRVGLVQAALLPLTLGVCVIAVPLQLGARSLALLRHSRRS